MYGIKSRNNKRKFMKIKNDNLTLRMRIQIHKSMVEKGVVINSESLLLLVTLFPHLKWNKQNIKFLNIVMLENLGVKLQLVKWFSINIRNY